MAGKYYKYKLLSDAPVKTVAETRNGFVIFEDGSRIEQNRLLDLFEEVSSSNVAGNTFASVTNTADIDALIKEQSRNKDIITPKQVINNDLTDVDVVNPDTFFDDSKIISNISTQAEKLAQSLNNIPETVDSTTGARVVEPPAVLPVDDNPGPVKQVIVNRDDYKQTEQQNEGFQPYTKTGEPIIPGAGAQYTQQPSGSIGSTLLSQMKRNKKIKLNLKVDEMMPNPSFIKMMDENFNGGILDYLVTDMVSKLINNPKTLEDQIRSALEEVVYGKKRRTTKKTTTAKKSTTKKPATKKTLKKVEKTDDKKVVEVESVKKENKEEISKDD